MPAARRTLPPATVRARLRRAAGRCTRARSFHIRVLASILASLLLALGLGVAGYSFLLSLRRGPLRQVEAPPPVPPTTSLPAPDRLLADPELRHRAMPASVAMDPREPSRIAIALRNVPAGLDRAVAGIALFASDTGADFVWTPLAALGADDTLATTTPIVGSVTITLARDQAFARHGYLARTTHTFSRSRGPLTALPFECGAASVRLTVDNPQHVAGPLRLRRVDDPLWNASDAAPLGITVRGKAEVELVLGAGDYELEDPVDPARRQRFRVPAAAPVQINAALSRPAVDRP